MEAIHRALKAAVEHQFKKVLIYTDSRYSINALTVWFKNWVKNGWKNSKKQVVVHKEQISKILELVEREKLEVKYEHVRGHAGVMGNEKADQLAVAGARAALKS